MKQQSELLYGSNAQALIASLVLVAAFPTFFALGLLKTDPDNFTPGLVTALLFVLGFAAAGSIFVMLFQYACLLYLPSLHASRDYTTLWLTLLVKELIFISSLLSLLVCLITGAVVFMPAGAYFPFAFTMVWFGVVLGGNYIARLGIGVNVFLGARLTRKQDCWGNFVS